MKAAAYVICAMVALVQVGALKEQKNPLGTALSLLKDLQKKLIKQGETEVKEYDEYYQWCDNQSRDLRYTIKTQTKKKDKATAKIEQLTSEIGVSTTKIEELAAAISTNEGELKEATELRATGAANFKVAEKELSDSVSAVARALRMLASQQKKGAAALAQIDTSAMEEMIQSVSTIVDAAAFENEDHAKLLSMLQAQHRDSNDDLDIDFGAPAAAKYETHSSGIIDMLEDLKDKAEAQLAAAQKAESSARHNFAMMSQSLNDQMKADAKDLDEEKASKAQSQEEKATAKSDLNAAVKELAAAKKELATVQRDCMTAAADHEATIAARAAELKVLVSAQDTLASSTGGAVKQTYKFLQVASASTMRTRADITTENVAAAVRKLAQKHHSEPLKQLASRISVMLQFGSAGGADPFVKVRGLLSSMITKLESEARSEANEKQYCDDEMKKTKAKKSDLEASIAKVVSQIDKAAARSASLKADVATLNKELAALAKSQAELDSMRQKANAAYKIAKADLEQGLGGVRKALEILREYYGTKLAMVQEGTEDDDTFEASMEQPKPPKKHSKSGGSAGGIIGLLEVVESDMADNLVKEETQESNGARDYAVTTTTNKMAKAEKEADVSHKSREFASLDKTISQLGVDKANTLSQQSAVLEYYSKLKTRCIAKPSSYEERKARRDSELAGLKDSLETLNAETASFLQIGFLQKRVEKHL